MTASIEMSQEEWPQTVDLISHCWNAANYGRLPSVPYIFKIFNTAFVKKPLWTSLITGRLDIFTELYTVANPSAG